MCTCIYVCVVHVCEGCTCVWVDVCACVGCAWERRVCAHMRVRGACVCSCVCVEGGDAYMCEGMCVCVCKGYVCACVRVYVCGGWACASEPLGAGQVGCVAKTQCQQQDLGPCPCIHALGKKQTWAPPARDLHCEGPGCRLHLSWGAGIPVANGWGRRDGGGPPMFQARRGGGGEQVFMQGPRSWQPRQGHDLGSGHYQRAPAPLRGSSTSGT